MSLVFFILVALSGLYFPVNPGSGLATFTDIFPIRHLITASVDSFNGIPGTSVWHDVLVMALWGVGGCRRRPPALGVVAQAGLNPYVTRPTPRRLEECREPRRRRPDPFPTRHLRRHRRRATGRDHRGRPGGDVRAARGAVEPAGPGPVRPRAAARRPRRGRPAQRRPHPRGGVRPPALGPLLHHGQHAPGGRRGGLHRGRLRCPHAHHVVVAGAPGRGSGRPHAGHRTAPDDRRHRRSPATRPTTSSSPDPRASRWPSRSKAHRCCTPRARPATPRGSAAR